MKRSVFWLMYLWQLPQNLLGLMLFHVKAYKPISESEYHGRRVLICGNFPGGISLGRYILVSGNRGDRNKIDDIGVGELYAVRHEYGHSRQSVFLGWLYLPVVGLPSILHAACHTFGWANGDYYKYWCEAWANRLAGIS